MRYRIEKLNKDNELVATEITDVHTIDGVLIFKCTDRLSAVEWKHLMETLSKTFPNRKVLILPKEIEFVRIVPESED